ncbi:MAG: hypothetical protein QOH26_1992 [Actinomycetota bacterium]|nr:hypothetical protein [Actinomycetota bacterium]
MKGERGQVLVLTLGLVMVCFAVSGLAVDGTRAFLLRRTLQNAADSAALAGAASLDRGAYYSSGGRVVSLDAGSAEREALSILRQRGVVAAASITADADGVQVRLRQRLPTSFLRFVGLLRLTVGADAAAAPVPGSR